MPESANRGDHSSRTRSFNSRELLALQLSKAKCASYGPNKPVSNPWFDKDNKPSANIQIPFNYTLHPPVNKHRPCQTRGKTTSGAAQGGGGSFRNRKPIGEIGCCESRMAERIHWWTERWLELCFLEWLQWLQWPPGRSPHPQMLDVVWCSAAVVVVVVVV